MSDLAVQNRESEQEVMPSFDFLLERETERNTLLAEHRAWLKEIKRERPLPKTHYRVAVYIRYFNQTRYEDYLSAHKKQFLDTLALCPESKQYLEEALRALFLYAPLGSTPKASGRLLRFGGYLYAGFLLPGGSTRPLLFARSRLEDTP